MPQILNRSGLPIKRDQIAPSRRVDVDEIEQTLATQQNQINQKANASTVGGLATAVNSKASQSSVDTLAGTIAGKADTTALASKANVSDLASKADVSALAAKANSSDVTNALATKADASALAAKASTSALNALAATVPVIADEIPQPETTGGQAGLEGMKVPGARHQHPRLTSTTGNPASHIIGATGLATVAFTQAFDAFPGTVFTEVPPPTGVMPAQPANFRVESWIRETMTPAPSGKYVGCVVRAWRGRNLPVISLLTGLLSLLGVNTIITALTGFDPFGAPATGTTFTCVAVKRSDVV
ncbi:hypothetical protein [Sphingobium sp. YR657]|uniref:hypothetical protein n=1 Tax=Sphingobium sp. YR657 TaxID=1884366 RepID=UPI003137993D